MSDNARKTGQVSAVVESTNMVTMCPASPALLLVRIMNVLIRCTTSVQRFKPVHMRDRLRPAAGIVLDVTNKKLKIRGEFAFFVPHLEDLPEVVMGCVRGCVK